MDQLDGNKMNNELLSENFKQWYSTVLSKVFGKQIDINGLKIHPHFLINNKGVGSSVEIIKSLKKGLVKRDSKIKMVGSSERVRKSFLLFKKYSFIKYLKLMPIITSADILQNPNKVCALLTLDLKNWYAVVEAKNFDDYLHTLKTLKKLTHGFEKKSISPIRLSVINDWMLIKEDGKAFFISKFLGKTLEQKFKDDQINENTKEKILDCLNKFALYCEDKNLYWRDLAPRNMFLSKDGKTITLIDFENLFDTTKMIPLTRIYWDKFRKVWFADVLDKSDIDHIYDGLQSFSIDEQSLLDSDLLEKNYFGKDKITTKLHLDFLDLTANFEKRHIIGKNIVYGHRIGLYLSDFHSSDDESKVYLAMKKLNTNDWNKFLSNLQKAVDIEQQNYLISLYTGMPRTNKVGEVLKLGSDK